MLGDSIGLFIRDWRFWMLVLFNSGNMIYFWGLNSWLPAYLRVFRHLNLVNAGLYSGLPFLMMLAGFMLGGNCRTRRDAGYFLLRGPDYGGALHPDGRAVFRGDGGSVVAGRERALLWLGGGRVAVCAGAPDYSRQGDGYWFWRVRGDSVYGGRILALGHGMGDWAAGNYNNGLAVLVVTCIVLAFPMVPLLREY